LVGKAKAKRLVGRPNLRWENNTEIDSRKPVWVEVTVFMWHRITISYIRFLYIR
jgi:hypothetical protein